MGSRLKHRWITFLTIAWVITLFLLVTWWTWVIRDQALTILDLTHQINGSSELAIAKFERTQRMIYAETFVFLLILVLSGVGIIWLYYRDHKRVQSIGNFYTTLTHELRTPLTSIRLQAEAMEAQLDNPKKLKEVLARLKEDAERLSSQIEKSLELARIETNGNLAIQDTSLYSVIEKSVSQWQGGKPQFEFYNQVDPNLCVKADQFALETIFRNLLDNATKHAHAQNLRIQLKSNEAKGTVEFIFQDNGQGVQLQSDDVGKLFKKGPESRGAGVGLYLTRSLIKKMGGKVEFRNANGFCVHIQLPKSELSHETA